MLDALDAAAEPTTHAELSASLFELDPVTLYRTLGRLVDVGLAHRVQGPDGVARFCRQPRTGGCPGNHCHFLCQRCGTMQCLVDQTMPRVRPPPGATVRARSFVASGICAACRRGAG